MNAAGFDTAARAGSPETQVIHLIKATGIAGAERHLLDLLPALRGHGCDARLWVLAEPRDETPALLAAAGERGIPAERFVLRGDLDLGLRQRLARAFRACRPEIVHTHLIHADFHGIPAARAARVPIVVTSRHNDDAFRQLLPMRLLNGRLWRRVDAGIAVSRALERFSREVEGARVPLRVIHHGIAPVAPLEPGERQGLRASLGVGPEALVLGTVCRLTKQKGVTFALRAFARVADGWPQAVLLVAGHGPERRRLEREARRLRLDGRVRFLGWQADSGRLLASLDVLLAPSLWEGFGLVLLEAMARGVPVLATTAGAIPEIVADGETGLLVPPRDPRALADGLERMLEDPALRARLGAAGLARARERFGLARMAEETLALYRALLGGTASRFGPRGRPKPLCSKTE